jgi:putative ABC transport system permease protein
VQGGVRFTLGKALVTGQVALSLMLLTAAGLFLGTLRNFLTVDTGYNTHHVLLVSAAVPPDRIAVTLRHPLFSRILRDLRALPGVRSAASSMWTPVTRFFWNMDVHAEGYTPRPIEDDTLVNFNRVSPGYFRTVESPLLMGRDFSDADTLTSSKVMIIGVATARHFWGTANPIGKTISLDDSKKNSYQVIGVVKDAKYGSLDEPLQMTAFVAASQDSEPGPESNFEIRFDGPAEALIPAVRSAIAAANKDAALEIQTLDAHVSDTLVQPRLVALLSSFFGFLALLLASIGLYGVFSYVAARRRGGGERSGFGWRWERRNGRSLG